MCCWQHDTALMKILAAVNVGIVAVAIVCACVMLSSQVLMYATAHPAWL